jgi:recombination protein RecA
MDKTQSLNTALTQIERQFGKGAVMRLGDHAQRLAVESIPTGSMALDIALGVGGFPRGRVVELYGPESSGKTTVALHVVAEAQRAGGVAAFIDAEHALDPAYAKNIGVDIDSLLVSQPDTGEQALEITDMLIRSSAVDIIVIDSVAALVPRAEIEGEMGDSHVGLQARLMSQALRKITGSVSKSNTCVVFINQIREKIGVMFGCMAGDTRVTLADGTSERIDRIVRNKMPVRVLSYEAELGQVVTRRVVNWFDNGPTEYFLQFGLPRVGGKNHSGFACTPNHRIRTPGGWREAQELVTGDRVLQATRHYLSDFQWEVILGALMGDGSLSPNQNGLACRFRIGHGVKQAEYCDWKASLFENIGSCRTTNKKGAVFHDLPPLVELEEVHRSVYLDGKKVFNDDYLKALTPLSLAIWYMDDAGFSIRAKSVRARTAEGSGRTEICVEAMHQVTRQMLVDYLAGTWGISATQVPKGGKATLVFAKDETAKLHELIAPFTHPSMQYKLLPRYRGRFEVQPTFSSMRYELLPVPITTIRRKASYANGHRFDIEVEGSHNYLVDGVVVHNSPETTPGGRALKFYSSVRLDVRRIDSIKDGADVIGNRVRAKVVKNKCSPPFRTCEFDLVYGKGISKEGSLLDVAVDIGIVKKSGAWFTFNGEQLGQGRENAKTFLSENIDVTTEIESLIRAHFSPNGERDEVLEGGIEQEPAEV